MGINRPRYSGKINLAGQSIQARLGVRMAATGKPGSKPGARHRGTGRRTAAITVICSTHRDKPQDACKACRGVEQQRRGRAAAPPPHMRPRQPLSPVPPLSYSEREDNYLLQNSTGRVLLGFTPAQRRRLDHKLGHAQARSAPGRPQQPPAAPPGPAMPMALSWSQRARRALLGTRR